MPMPLDAGNWIAILIAIVGIAATWGGLRYRQADVHAEVRALKGSIDKLGARIGDLEKTGAAFEERIAHIADSVGLRKDIRRALAQAGLQRRPSQAVPIHHGNEDSGDQGGGL